MVINWYPGHMAKAKRQITEQLKLIDVVIEVLDARIPYSSRNPDISSFVKDKHHIIVLNKADLADCTITDEWEKMYKDKYGIEAVSVNAVNGDGIKGLLQYLREVRDEISGIRAKKGLLARPVRVMVLGIPNVGKSKLINRIAGINKARVENRPGVTHSLSWLRLKNNIELMDTPGLLWPKQNDRNVGINLALTGTINPNIVDVYELSLHLINKLLEIKPAAFVDRYAVSDSKVPEDVFFDIADKRGCKLKGGEIDFERTSKLILNDFQTGKLGRISLERPEWF
ncbi:ribosome biogenesis GTPase YlqF [Calorimonas adulescens]|uniref:Ribosome biogenesis GTPase A n=1 Tax=Calorimonas adulescens TaxID=2606906 RepID=A0A5D8QFA6_9THEO|nr:ribosome biogenesis GTPase YlqF [Calorimonas adulescens]TZE83370.1 ribosome biogenesis GTPase YlqF [Calorimonas adulescens]